MKLKLPTFGTGTPVFGASMMKPKMKQSPRSLNDIISRMEYDINELQQRAVFDKAESDSIGEQIAKLQEKQKMKLNDSDRGNRIADKFMELIK